MQFASFSILMKLDYKGTLSSHMEKVWLDNFKWALLWSCLPTGCYNETREHRKWTTKVEKRKMPAFVRSFLETLVAAPRRGVHVGAMAWR